MVSDPILNYIGSDRMNVQKKLGLENPVPKKLQLKIEKLWHLRWVCRGTVIMATLTSVWANWLHSDNDPAAVAINIFPPLIILAGYELLSRIPTWDNGSTHPLRWLHPRRWIVPVAMAGITGIGAWLSYWHQKAAFFTYSGDPETAKLLPLAIDGLMIISSVAVLNITDKLDSLIAYAEAGGVTTYKPVPRTKEPELPPKAKDKTPSKKQMIVDYLTRFPEYKPEDIATRTGATANYVYKVIDELRKSQSEDQDMQPAVA